MAQCKDREEQQKKRYKAIASNLPILPGTIVSKDGVPIDISDLFGIPATEEDPQTAKARGFSPFIRDIIALQDGRSCSLLDLIDKLTTVDDAELDRLKAELAQLMDKVGALLLPPDCTDADKVGTPLVEITEDGRFKFSELKGEQGKQGEEGKQGIQGPPGEKGEKGDNLYSFSVQEGDLYIKMHNTGDADVTYEIDRFGNMTLTIN